jgi:hypothetical protein
MFFTLDTAVASTGSVACSAKVEEAVSDRWLGRGFLGGDRLFESRAGESVSWRCIAGCGPFDLESVRACEGRV